MTSSQQRTLLLPVGMIACVVLTIASVCTFFIVRAIGNLDDVSKQNREILKVHRIETQNNREGIACILEQLNAHRVNSHSADKQNAETHHEVLDPPAPSPVIVPSELLKACDKFLEYRGSER